MSSDDDEPSTDAGELSRRGSEEMLHSKHSGSQSSLNTLDSAGPPLSVSAKLAMRTKRQSISSTFSVASSTVSSTHATVKLQNMDTDDPLDSMPIGDLTGLEISLVPTESQTKECNAAYRSLLPRKLWADFLVKRGGMRQNWKTRYFLLTGDHLHYFEPQTLKGTDQMGEPAANAAPLGSIPLHAITGKVHRSDLGIVFGFQVPTAQRTYHFQAMSARRIDKWLSVLNANTKRIQSASSKFSDTVFRVTTFWGNHQMAVLRTGREFVTLGQRIETEFAELNPLPFPRELMIEPAILSNKDAMGHLLEYLKGVLRIDNDRLLDVMSAFLRDLTTDFFVFDVRKSQKEADTVPSVEHEDPFLCMAVSPMRRFPDRTTQMVLLGVTSERMPNGTDLHIYDFDGGLVHSYSRRIEGQITGKVRFVRFSPDGDLFFTMTFTETSERREEGQAARRIGSFEITIWRLDTLEAVLTLSGAGFPVLVSEMWLLNDLFDSAVTRRKTEPAHLIAVANSSRSVAVWNVEERTLVRSVTLEFPKGLDGLRTVRFCPTEPALVALGGDYGVQVWDHVKNEFLVNIKYKATSIAVSPDGKRLAGIGTQKSRVKYWDMRTGKTTKSLACGYSMPNDDVVHHPHVSFHPKNSALLVCNSLGDVVAWSFIAETTEETQTIANVEQVWATERPTTTPTPGSSTGVVLTNTATMFPGMESALQKAKALEPAVYAECRGVITNVSSRADFVKYSADGSLILMHSFESKSFSVWLSRNGDLVAEFPAASANATFFSADISSDGKHIVFIDGKTCHTKRLPIDSNGDIVDETEVQVVDSRSFGFVLNHIEHDPMIPLHNHQVIISICENDLPKLKKIVKGFNLNLNFRSFLDGWTPLLLACKLGQPKTVRSLVKYGADLGFGRGIDNLTPLHAAASSGSLKTVMTLIELGVNPNSAWDPFYGFQYLEPGGKPPTTGITALHIAAYMGCADIVDFLLSAGADLEGKDSNGRTAIIYACANKSNLAVVQVLVRRGCDCTVRLRTGTSAMHEAAKNDNQKMVMLLLQEGAGAENERNSVGLTPVDLNPQLFSKRSLSSYLRSDTKEYLKYQKKIASGGSAPPGGGGGRGGSSSVVLPAPASSGPLARATKRLSIF